MQMTRTLLTAAGGLGAALAAYWLLLRTPALELVQLWTAGLTGLTLRLVDSDIVTNGTIVSSPDFAIQIVAECTIFGPILLYMAAVALYPASWAAKLRGLLLGVAVLVPVNTLRMTSLFYVGQTFPSYLDTAHLLLWQPLLLLLTIALWLWWASRPARAVR